MSASFSIPVVDFLDFTSTDIQRQNRFTQGVGHALQEIGFFALTNHGVADDLIAQAYQESAQLFALPEAEKLSYEDRALKGQRGYTAFGREHAKDSKTGDLKEFWHIGRAVTSGSMPENIWPKNRPSFRSTFEEIYLRLEQSAMAVLEACAMYIGEERLRFRSIAEGGDSILRLIHYPPIPANADPRAVRAGAHEDINLITLLIDATSSGLELLDRQGEWRSVVTPRGCIIIDAGDMLQNITNGLYKSTTHRVVNPDNKNVARYSMPFFMHARSECDLSPLKSCVQATGQQRYQNITAGAYLHQRLQEIGLA